MTNGQIVLITTQRLGGGEPQLEPVLVAEADPQQAERTTRKALGLTPDVRVEAKWPVHHSMMPMDMAAGTVRPFWP